MKNVWILILVLICVAVFIGLPAVDGIFSVLALICIVLITKSNNK